MKSIDHWQSAWAGALSNAFPSNARLLRAGEGEGEGEGDSSEKYPCEMASGDLTQPLWRNRNEDTKVSLVSES